MLNPRIRKSVNCFENFIEHELYDESGEYKQGMWVYFHSHLQVIDCPNGEYFPDETVRPF
jgi:hypothetical protein